MLTWQSFELLFMYVTIVDEEDYTHASFRSCDSGASLKKANIWQQN